MKILRALRYNVRLEADIDTRAVMSALVLVALGAAAVVAYVTLIVNLFLWSPWLGLADIAVTFVWPVRRFLRWLARDYETELVEQAEQAARRGQR